MHISHVKISNILGIEDMEFEPGQFTTIEGQNGQGKTSVLEAIKAAIGKGHDATLLRKDAEKGEVVIVLDDGTEITKRVRPTASDTTITRDGKKLPRPSEEINALVDLISVNPVDFLRAPKKDRVKVLLESMPLKADVDKLTEISGVPIQIDPGTHALVAIEQVHKQVYDDRTGTNRAVREKESTINQLQAAMPDQPGGVEGNETELEAQLAAANEALEAERLRIHNKLEGLQAESNARIEALRQQIEAEKAAFTEIQNKAQLQRQKATEKHTETTNPIKVALAAIRADRASAAKRQATLETIETMKKEAEQLAEDAKRQTKALSDLDQYKSDLLASLPIPGVTVKDGEILREGIPFDRLNTAQQVQIAVEIAKLRTGKLSVACVDGLELLDGNTFAEFKQQAIDSGLQLFVTRVSDQNFTVNHD